MAVSPDEQASGSATPAALEQQYRGLRCDVIIVGGGIVGLASALAISDARPDLKLVVLEKEAEVGSHQTGHNSGVVHSGIYYRPGSLKAELCRQGVALMQAFCREHDVPYSECGKVIVATEENELAPLRELLSRGVANGVPGLRLLGPVELRELEPNVRGLQAIHSPTTAITDYGAVARKLAAVLTARGVTVLKNAKVGAVVNVERGITVHGPQLEVTARYLVNCAGLHADVVARLCGLTPDLQIVPFRGEYYLLTQARSNLVHNLVYPVPNAALPFLGVHFTRTIDGSMEAGPNAVLAFAREGYKTTTFDLDDTARTLGFGGFWRLARRFWRVGAYEYYRSFSKAAFVASLQRLVPSIAANDLVPGHTGVRAQAVARDGRLLDDFVFMEGAHSLHVLNAPSPAATASLAIGKHVAARLVSSMPS